MSGTDRSSGNIYVNFNLNISHTILNTRRFSNKAQGVGSPVIVSIAEQINYSNTARKHVPLS